MNIIQQLKDSIKDETSARNEYDELIDEINKDSKLKENDKNLIMGILYKISTDEKTHKILLKIIDKVLDTYE